MSIFVDENTKVIYQGLTGSQGSYYGGLNRAYGTQVVAGTHPKKAGTDVDGVPIYASVAEAKEATGATASCIFIPAPGVQGAVLEHHPVVQGDQRKRGPVPSLWGSGLEELAQVNSGKVVHGQDPLVRDRPDTADPGPYPKVFRLRCDRVAHPDAASLGMEPPDHRAVAEEQHHLPGPRIEPDRAETGAMQLSVELSRQVAYEDGVPSDRHLRS